MLTSAAVAIWIIRSLVFLLVAVPTCLYAARRGGAPERLVGAMVVVATIATTLVPRQSWQTVVEPLLVIDGVMFIGLVAVALYADRFWPLYFAAVQLLTMAVHGVRAYDQTILPEVYARISGELAYIALGILAVGTWRHRRRSPEPDWSWQVKDEQSSFDAR